MSYIFVKALIAHSYPTPADFRVADEIYSMLDGHVKQSVGKGLVDIADGADQADICAAPPAPRILPTMVFRPSAGDRNSPAVITLSGDFLAGDEVHVNGTKEDETGLNEDWGFMITIAADQDGEATAAEVTAALVSQANITGLQVGEEARAHVSGTGMFVWLGREATNSGIIPV